MKKGNYVDGFVLAVPEGKLAAYKKMAREGCEIWKKHGALDYKECVADDVEPDMGPHKIRRFPEMAKQKEGEVVIFSFIVFESRAHRDRVNAKVMKEMEEWMAKQKNVPAMPFDMKRMAYGGFKVLVSM
jgi:alkaline phosphatase